MNKIHCDTAALSVQCGRSILDFGSWQRDNHGNERFRAQPKGLRPMRCPAAAMEIPMGFIQKSMAGLLRSLEAPGR